MKKSLLVATIFVLSVAILVPNMGTATPVPATKTVTFLAAGDISLSRNVAARIKKYKDPLLPFRSLETLLRSTDFNFANLESPFSGKSYAGKTGSLVFNAPVENVTGLKAYNFKVLNLANNHALDQGTSGSAYTRDLLTKQGIAYVGTGTNLDQAWQPAIINAQGFNIGFIGASYSSINDNGKTTNNYVARIEDVQHLTKAVQDLRTKVDFVVVTMHAGTEYTRKPNRAQVAFAHAAIDAGANMVIGAHPHWVQTVEKYHGKYIFYSLGNFIFDQMWSQQTREGLTLKITLATSNNQTDIQNIQLIPIIIDNYSTPRLASVKESKKILTAIGQSKTVLTP